MKQNQNTFNFEKLKFLYLFFSIVGGFCFLNGTYKKKQNSFIKVYLKV